MPDKDREDKIRARAHELWELEGRPEGAGERHWLQASGEVDAKPAAKKPAAKKATAAKPKAPKSAAKPSAAGANAKPAPGKKPAAPKKK